MMRLVLAIVAAMALSGCQHSGQQAIDPFWGRTTVPSPATGSIRRPDRQPGMSATLAATTDHNAGNTAPTAGSSNRPQPNLLPAPMSPTPGAPGTLTPMPATPGPAGSGVPYGNGAPAITSPPSGYPTPGRAPPSGYSNPIRHHRARRGRRRQPCPGPPPAGSYPSSPARQRAGGMAPPTGGTAPTGPVPAQPHQRVPHRHRPGRFATVRHAPRATFRPVDYNYDDRNGVRAPEAGGNWITPAALRPPR